MNVTDLRVKLRRSPRVNQSSESISQERRKAERRKLLAESSGNEDITHRIWLTPGERTLIEDLYLLDGADLNT